MMKHQSMTRKATLWAVTLLAALLLTATLFPAPASAQAPAPIGVYLNMGSTGSPAGDKILLSIREDGTAVMLFFNLEEQLGTLYPGVWLLDPYGTVTLELELEADDSCSGEDEVGTITFLPSPSGGALTAVHYPSCVWGDGSLTLVPVADDTVAAVEAAYADAGLLPGLVFLSDPLMDEAGGERMLTLNLGQGDQAQMITTPADDAEPTVEVGVWSATVYTVTVTLTGTEEEEYAEPDVLSFGFLKDGTGRMAAFEYDSEKYGDQGVLMTYTPELPQMLAATQAEAAPTIPGIYTSGLLPAADSPGLVITLALFDNGAAQSTSDYLNAEAPVVEVGTWTDNADDTVTLAITGTPAEEYAETLTMTLTVAAGQLDADGVIFTLLPVSELPVSEPPDDEQSVAGEPVAYFKSDTLPAASSPGRVVELVLLDDGSAAMRTDYLNDEAPLVEVGIWEEGADTLTVTLTGSRDQEYDAPVTIVFTIADDQLVATEYDVSLFGEEGLTLLAQPLDTLESSN
jgi:uncharacterized lipoprotein NlpE involved in copper resistance